VPLEITALGTGHGNVEPGRGQSAFLLRADGADFLVDAGEPCAASLRALGVAPGALKAVLLTHCHADHVGGLPLLLQAAWGDRLGREVPVVAPAHALEPLAAWLNFSLGLLPPQPGFGCQLSAWRNTDEFDFDEISVTPFRTTHLARAGGAAEAFSLDVRFRGRRICFSGDIGHPDDLGWMDGGSFAFAACEVSHIEPSALVRSFANRRIGTLALTHISAENLPVAESIRLQFVAACPRIDRVVLAADGMNFLVDEEL